jgi:hypothetical protein
VKEETPVVSEVVALLDDALSADKNESQTEMVISETVEKTPSTHELSELVKQTADHLAVETVEILNETVVSETVDANSGDEETPPAPAVTQAENALATETVESPMEAVNSETVDESIGVEEAADTEENNECKRNSTFLTEIEEVGEKQVKEKKTDELDQLDQLDQLEKSIAESEKDFPTDQLIGEIKEDVECTKEEEALPDMTTENIEIINEQNEGLQDEFMIESELEEITPIKTDIKEDDEEDLGISVEQIEEEEAKAVGSEEEPEKEFPNEEPVETIEEAVTLFVDSSAEDQSVLNDNHQSMEILDEPKKELKDIKPIPEESIEGGPEKPSLNIDVDDTKKAEKIPVLTIFMIAYVVFMALFVFTH